MPSLDSDEEGELDSALNHTYDKIVAKKGINEGDDIMADAVEQICVWDVPMDTEDDELIKNIEKGENALNSQAYWRIPR